MKSVLISLLILCSWTLTFGGQASAIRLTTGEVVKILSSDQIKSDWNYDFKDHEANLLKLNRISKFLDGKNKTFIEEEKGYWIAYYGKSPNIKRLYKHNSKSLIIHQIYFLQKILLMAKNKVKKAISDKLKETVYQIYPSKLSATDILLIRGAGARGYLSSQSLFKSDYNKLKLKGQRIIAQFYVQPTELNRIKVLNHLSILLSNFENLFEDYYTYLKNTNQLGKSKESLREFIGEGKEKVDNPEGIKGQENATSLEGLKKQKVKDQMTKINRFLQVLLQTDDKPLILKGIQLKESFLIKLKKNYGNFKSLDQSRGKGLSD